MEEKSKRYYRNKICCLGYQQRATVLYALLNGKTWEEAIKKADAEKIKENKKFETFSRRKRNEKEKR